MGTEFSDGSVINNNNDDSNIKELDPENFNRSGEWEERREKRREKERKGKEKRAGRKEGRREGGERKRKKIKEIVRNLFEKVEALIGTIKTSDRQNLKDFSSKARRLFINSYV